jgi:phage terminase small subunit
VHLCVYFSVFECSELKTTDLQHAFVIEFVANGGIATKAAASAGYSQQSARQIASQLLNKPHIQEAIRREQRKRLYGLGSKAMSVIESILYDDEAPAGVRLDAAKTVLDRCGLTAETAKVEQMQASKPLEEMTAIELQAFIQEGMKQLKAQQSSTVEGEAVLVN